MGILKSQQYFCAYLFISFGHMHPLMLQWTKMYGTHLKVNSKTKNAFF